MSYNDFQILSNEEYAILNNQFLARQNFDRNATIFQIKSTLNSCKNSCLSIANKYNTRIKSEIEQTHKKLNKILENFNSLFGTASQSTEIKNINIFSFIDKLISITQQIYLWQKNEQKKYYNSFAEKTIFELLEIIANLIKQLDKSNIITFKYM